jgi:replication factor A1
VTAKGNLRTFSKGATSGKVFHVDLLDKEGGEIRASFFNDAVDKFESTLQVGKCFVFSRGSVKIANRQYNQCNHRYEITFDKDAIVAPSADDAEIQSFQFRFVDMRTLQKKTLPAKVDLCGVITSFKPALSFTSKDGKELVKREITVTDDTATSVDVTLWGDRAKTEDAKFDGKPVMALRGVLVKEWNGGRSGSLLQDGAIVFNPDGAEAQRIQKWWSEGGSSQNIEAMSSSVVTGTGARRDLKEGTLSDMRAVVESMPEKPEHYNVVTRLSTVQTRKQGEIQPLTYMACTLPREGTALLCNRRVDESGYCQGCGRNGNPAPRLNVRCRFVDFADSAWLTTFHEAAEKVIGMTGDQVRGMEAESPPGAGEDRKIDECLKSRYYMSQPFQITVRAKTESYNGEVRTQISCVDARPVQRREHGRKLLGEIHSMLGAAVAA